MIKCPKCESTKVSKNHNPNKYVCKECGRYFTHKVNNESIPIASIPTTSLKPISKLEHDFNLSGDRIRLIPIGDIHIGAPESQCNYAKLERELTYILNTEDCYMIGMGDYMDCASKVVRKGPSVFSSSLSPMQQYEKIKTAFEPLAKKGKILGLLKGNHEDWIIEDAGIDLVSLLCDSLKVPYLGSACDVKFTILNSGISYLGYVQHGSSSAKLASTKIGSALNATREIFADFYLYGHVHQVAATKISKWMYGEEQKAYQILTGHFLRWQGGYAQSFGISPSPTGVAKISLFANSKDIHVSI